jgi:Holliday junction resolvase RusA-like endonuclease
MIGDTLFTPELLAELHAEDPNWDKVKAMVIACYNSENNANIDINKEIAKADADRVILWMNEISLRNPRIGLLSFTRSNSIVPLLSTTLSEKVITIGQYNCPFCTDNNSFPILNIPIRISAVSKQVIAKDPVKLKAFEGAIRHYLKDRGGVYQRGEKLCLHIVYVLGKGNRNKDLDNMAKALLDAIKGTLFVDDLDIDHLNLMKVVSEETDDFIKINIRKSGFNQHQDVLFKIFRHEWAVGPFLSLEEFM